MDLLLLDCKLSKFSVNWKIQRFVSFKSQSCPNSPRFTLYLLNKCNLQSPQSIWSFSCKNNVIDLLFESLSLSLSVHKSIWCLCSPQNDLQPLNLALFYAHPKTDSGQFEDEGEDWLQAVLCFGLFSLRAFPKTFQIYLLGTLSNVCSTFNWLPHLLVPTY